MPKKDLIVLIHGWGGTDESLSPLAEVLSEDFDVLNFNLPGFGGSKEPSSVWGISNYSEWVLKQAKKKGSDKFHIIGHSFGGQIATKLTLTYPENIKTLTLIGAAVIRRKSHKAKLIGFLSKGVKKVSFDFLGRFLQSADYRKSSPKMRNIMSKILTEDLSDKLHNVVVPTLILWGEQDRQTPLTQAKVIKNLIPKSELEVVKGAGHNLPLIKPELVGTKVIKHIKKWK